MHLEPLHRARELHRHPQPVGQRLVQTGHPRPAADRVHPAQPARRARRRREECRRPLHPHRDLLAPRVDVLRQVGALRLSLDDPLGVFGGQPLLPLQTLAEPPRAHRQVPRQHRDAVFQDVHVGHFVPDVDQPHDALHRVGMVQLERVVDRKRVHVDDRRLEPRLAQKRRAALHQLALGGHEQHVHLQPSASGSRIWKSSSTLAISNGTCCSASHRITSRASPSFMRSIWIFLTITSRPPTAVTTERCFTPAVEKRPRIASATIPGSMTSPSTMASAATSVVATLTSSASLPEWSITATLMIPEPMSNPTEVFLPPKNPKRAISA